MEQDEVRGARDVPVAATQKDRGTRRRGGWPGSDLTESCCGSATRATEVMPLPVDVGRMPSTWIPSCSNSLSRRRRGRFRIDPASPARRGSSCARRPRDADHGATLVPHAQGQRAHGWRRAHRRVLLGRREPAQSSLINRTLTRTPPMIEFIKLKPPPRFRSSSSSSRSALNPGCGHQPADRACQCAFAEGDPERGRAANQPAGRPVRSRQEAEKPALEMDPVLYDVFSKETAGHLKVITSIISMPAQGHSRLPSM